MTHYLLELSIGPVQGFIAAARRSRDLWAGSYILSELARAVGDELVRQNAELIYPLQDRVERRNDDEDSNLSNVLLARVKAEDEAGIRAIAAAARQAARERLRKFADRARAEWREAGVEVRDEFWDRQVEDAVEAYAAWARIGPEGYRPAYDRLKAAFAARKATRDFAPMFPPEDSGKGAGVPKCSFDGLRESVLPKGRRQFPARFGLSSGEQLDALGCIKRVEGKGRSFPALTRMAADRWIRRLSEDEVAGLNRCHEPLRRLGLATRAPVDRFPYDAGLLFPERLERAKKDAEAMEEAKAIRAALNDLETVLKPLWGRHRQPCPYAVLVVADGDRMGRFVDKAESPEDHARISRAVASFADQVPEIARNHGGYCVFNGGEDLTVMLPLAGLIGGARELSQAFDGKMASLVKELCAADEDAQPTLRVGAAICHVLEPLGTIRQWANAAEKFAKGPAGARDQGNALGIMLHIRAGHEIGVRTRFDDDDGFAALAGWQGAYAGGEVPGRLAYDTRTIALRCRMLRADAGVAEAEFRRLLARARQQGGADGMTDPVRESLLARQAALARPAAGDDPAGLFRLADELILARWLSAATAAEVGALEGGR